MEDTIKHCSNLKSVFKKIYFVGLILIPFILIILPADFFDTGQSICLSILIFNQKCYACGMTKAIQHLIHLDFKTANMYNWLAFIVFPLLLFLWIQELVKTYRRITKCKPK
jgi:hypothetical protein